MIKYFINVRKTNKIKEKSANFEQFSINDKGLEEYE